MKALSSQRGLALIVVVAVLLVLATVGVVVTAVVSTDSDIALNFLQATQAFYVAEAGREYAIKRVKDGTSLTTNCTTRDLVTLSSSTTDQVSRVCVDLTGLFPDQRWVRSSGEVTSPLVSLARRVANAFVTGKGTSVLLSVIRGAGGHEVVTVGWENAANALGSIADGLLVARARNFPGLVPSLIDSRLKSFGLDSVIPEFASIQAVRIIPHYRVNNDEAFLHVQATVFGSDCPATPIEEGPIPPVNRSNFRDATFDVTSCRAWTRADLLDTNNFKVRIGAHLHPILTDDADFRLDRVLVSVHFTAPLTLVSWLEVFE